MGKVIIGRFPPSFPHKRKGRKRLEPIKIGQLWARIQFRDWWRVEKITLNQKRVRTECPKNVKHIGRRIHIRHVDANKFPNSCSWLKKDFSEVFFRRCFMEKEEYEKFCAEIRKKGASIPPFDPDSRALVTIDPEPSPA